MISIRLARALLIAAGFAALSFQTALAQDRVLVNGKIFTANPQQPYAEAVSIRGGKIIAVGNRREVDASVGSDAQVVDLGGKTLLPGLIDSHVHAVMGGVGLLSADAKNEIPDIAALEAFVAQAKSSGRGMSGDVLVVTGIPLTIWSQNAALNARFNAGDYANHRCTWAEWMDIPAGQMSHCASAPD
jgi:predicted amidohydrolase YtcJ